MNQGRYVKRRVWILVKAFPQPSQKYEETVCCAGIAEDTGELLSKTEDRHGSHYNSG